MVPNVAGVFRNCADGAINDAMITASVPHALARHERTVLPDRFGLRRTNGENGRFVDDGRELVDPEHAGLETEKVPPVYSAG
jgi:hypothetical protein